MAYHIISIGVSNYQYNNIGSLNWAAEDAKMIGEGFQNNITNTTCDCKILANSEATLSEIYAYIDSDAVQSASSSDTFIFFFSGHGGIDEDNNSCLLTYDANARNLKMSSISVSKLEETLKQLKHGTKIILLDACHSGVSGSKSVILQRGKSFGSETKSFNDIHMGNGEVIFTACKKKEEAWELANLKHGAFTYALMQELLSEKQNEKVALSSIVHPVQQRIENILGKLGRTQTPTLNITQEGSVMIPRITASVDIDPLFDSTAVYTSFKTANVSVPKFKISDNKLKQLIGQATQAVVEASKDRLGTLGLISHTQRILNTLNETYEKQPKSITTNDELQDMLLEIESESTTLLVLLAITVLVGEPHIAKLLASRVCKMAEWKHHKSGTVGAVEIPDVILLLSEYLICICSIYIEDFTLLGELLNQPIRMPYGTLTETLGGYMDLHYADSLGVNARQVFKHVVDFISSQTWIRELLGVNNKQLSRLLSQANLCLCVCCTYYSHAIYASYHHYPLENLTDFCIRLSSDKKLQLEVSKLFPSTEKDPVTKIFRDSVEKINSIPNVEWWDKLNPEIFVNPNSGISAVLQ